jgi:hypothetical protein
MLQQWRTEAVQNSRAGTGCTSPSYASSIFVRVPQRAAPAHSSSVWADTPNVSRKMEGSAA